MNRGAEFLGRLRSLPRWAGFGFLMGSIWPLVLLTRHPGVALMLALPALVLFFIATSGRRTPPPPGGESPDATP